MLIFGGCNYKHCFCIVAAFVKDYHQLLCGFLEIGPDFVGFFPIFPRHPEVVIVGNSFINSCE